MQPPERQTPPVRAGDGGRVGRSHRQHTTPAAHEPQGLCGSLAIALLDALTEIRGWELEPALAVVSASHLKVTLASMYGSTLPETDTQPLRDIARLVGGDEYQLVLDLEAVLAAGVLAEVGYPVSSAVLRSALAEMRARRWSR